MFQIYYLNNNHSIINSIIMNNIINKTNQIINKLKINKLNKRKTIYLMIDQI